MMPLLEFSPIDCYFGRFLKEVSGEERKEFLLICSLVSRLTRDGHICLDLEEIANTSLSLPDGPFRLPSLDKLRDILLRNSTVGLPGEFKPLILDGNNRLYLYRYWWYEDRLARYLAEKSKEEEEISPILRGSWETRLRKYLPPERDLWQELAVCLALFKKLIVISGSPGTGKTTTIAKILALLIEMKPNPTPSIFLAAPTGKAAIRIKEAIRKVKEALPCPEEVKKVIPDEAYTIHRLLGVTRNLTSFRYHEGNPLPADLVVVDEASMLDLPLFAKFVAALPKKVRLVLLGDKDQLTSVQPGAVLGDICGGENIDIFSASLVHKIATVTALPMGIEVSSKALALNDCLVELKRNYRFDKESGIAQVARAVREGNAELVLSLLVEGNFSDIRWIKGETFIPYLRSKIREGYGAYLNAARRGEIEKVFELFDSFRVLCALRRSIWGVEWLNRIIEGILKEEGLITSRGTWYEGKPLLITRNDYRTGLFNGDVGIVLAHPNGEGMRAFFREPKGSIRHFFLPHLPPYEVAYAMTVHKSQGSEFDRVLIVLPEEDNPLLTRELIYTALTRAKVGVEIWARATILRNSILRQERRKSGLRDKLWK